MLIDARGYYRSRHGDLIALIQAWERPRLIYFVKLRLQAKILYLEGDTLNEKAQ